MNKYKILSRYNEDGKVILSSRLLKSDDKEYYYDLIEKENSLGNRQFILTKDIMLDTMLEYILNEKHTLLSIKTDSEKMNRKLAKHVEKAKDDRAYIALVIAEINSEDENSYISIHELSVGKHEEIINMYIDGIIESNVVLEDKLLDTISNSYHGLTSY